MAITDRGRFLGALIVGLFAAIWSFFGLGAAFGDGPVRMLGPAISVAVVVAASRLGGSRAGPDWRRARRPFLVVFGAEILGVIVVANLAAYLGRLDLVLPGISLIVGAHFLPLARLFGRPRYVPVGLLIMALAIASLLLREPSRDALVALGTATLLWASCFV